MIWNETAKKKPEPGQMVLACIVGRMTGKPNYLLVYMTRQGGWNLAGEGRALYATPMYWQEIEPPEGLSERLDV